MKDRASRDDDALRRAIAVAPQTAARDAAPPADALQNSPRMVAQRRHMASAFGPARSANIDARAGVVQGYFITRPDGYRVATQSGPLFTAQSSKPSVVEAPAEPAEPSSSSMWDWLPSFDSAPKTPGKTPFTVGYTAAPEAPPDVSLRVADDGSMAVHHTRAEPKEFYAIPAVIASANAKLEGVGSAFALDNTAGNKLAVGGKALDMIRPVNRQKSVHGEADRFSNMIEHVCIKMAGRLIGNQGKHSSEVVLGHGAATVPIKPGSTSDERITRLAGHVADSTEAHTLPTPQTAKTAMTSHNAIAEHATGERYGRATAAHGADAEEQALGINAYARPDVGEGFAIFTNQAEASGKRDYSLPTVDADFTEQADIWGYHFAGVAARSLDGADWMTLENYNRSPDVIAEVKNVQAKLLERYASLVGSKAASLRLGEDPDDMEIGTKFRELIAIIAKDIGADATLEYIRILGAAQPEERWFFRLYGSKGQQSFHEEQAAGGEVSNPITVHVRKQFSDVLAEARAARDAEWKALQTTLNHSFVSEAWLWIGHLRLALDRQHEWEEMVLKGATDRDALRKVLGSFATSRQEYAPVRLLPQLQLIGEQVRDPHNEKWIALRDAVLRYAGASSDQATPDTPRRDEPRRDTPERGTSAHDEQRAPSLRASGGLGRDLAARHPPGSLVRFLYYGNPTFGTGVDCIARVTTVAGTQVRAVVTRMVNSGTNADYVVHPTEGARNVVGMPFNDLTEQNLLPL
jgi:hypothetical protein